MAQASKSLQLRKSELADPSVQLNIINRTLMDHSFEHVVAEKGMDRLRAHSIRTLQVNVGKLCNMSCSHCHVDAGPDRKEENMSRQTIDECLAALEKGKIEVVDLTGGAPEMNSNFRYFVKSARALGVHVIDRCNLTILLANGYTDMPEFLAENGVEVVASLPCYLEDNTDKQRGDGAYQESITALRRLNDVGYATDDSDKKLTLVFNPVGISLPPEQSALEDKYRQHLRKEYGIEFTGLFTITNMPISRFLEDLIERGKHEEYMQSLLDAYNPAAIEHVMCRSMLSVSWDGRLFDCDFNQMLELPMDQSVGQHIRDFDFEKHSTRQITTAQHCFGCTAGSGSSCGGSLS